jgi:hypothetical protein
MAIELKTSAEFKPVSHLRQALRQFSAAWYMMITKSVQIEDYSADAEL